MRLSIDTQVGTLRGVCESENHLRAAVGPVLNGVFEPGRAARAVDLANVRAWFKGSHLRGKALLRNALKQRILRRPAHRVREYENLAWLRERLFQAPKPLAAGVLLRHGFPTYQFLAAELLEDVVTLDQALAQGGDGRAGLLDELARELARMHALHFEHHDLFMRNLLVAPAGAPRRIHFTDCWRGGPSKSLRTAAYDLGCLFLEAAGMLDAGEQRAFLERYFAERAQHGKPPPRDKLLDAAAKVRAGWLARVKKDPSRWRLADPPAEGWDPAG